MKYAALIAFLLLVGLTALSGVQFQPGPWYAELTKPDWTPPNWLFAPVWTALYLMIAVAGWRVWNAQGLGAALAAWIVAFVLNGVWSYLMFGLHRIDLAFTDIVGLLISILAFILLAFRADRIAAWLFVPYALWVGFAAALNFAILQLNS